MINKHSLLLYNEHSQQDPFTITSQESRAIARRPRDDAILNR